jgi:membrane-anchored mycosin MYCP
MIVIRKTPFQSPSAAIAAIVAALVLPLVASAAPASAAPTALTAEGDCLLGALIADAPPALLGLQSNAVWQLATGRGVTVAVVDSGIDVRNMHLQGAVIGGINLVDDGEHSQGFTDLDGHGTAIAGQIAARAIEGSGVVGLAYESQLLSVRVFRAQDQQTIEAGFGPTAERISEGIVWAADNGASIINVSLSDFSEGAGLRAAVDYATQRGALVVASGGNRGTTGFTADSIRYPAGYPGVLGVAATNELGVVTDASIRGPQVAVAAPGVSVLTTAAGATDCVYATEEASTSFATGYASAAAALVAQAHPSESPVQWKYRLEASASRANADSRDDRSGWGVIQPYDAITMIPSASTRGPVSPFVDTGSSAIKATEVVVDPRPSDSPFGYTVETLMYLAISATTVLAVLGLLVVLRNARRRQAAGASSGQTVTRRAARG